jgi:hypothetical protein
MAVARRPSPAPRAHSVLLIGGVIAQGMAPALRALSLDAKVPIAVDSRPDTTPADWFGLLGGQIMQGRPNFVLVALEPDMHALQLDAQIRAAHAHPLWLMRTRNPPLNGLTAETLHIPLQGDRMTPTVAGYAAWAAHCWRLIR